MDHDANVEPWKLLARDFDLKIRWLPFDIETFEFDLADLDELFTDRTRLLCVGSASNLTGTLNDVETICNKARRRGVDVYRRCTIGTTRHGHAYHPNARRCA